MKAVLALTLFVVAPKELPEPLPEVPKCGFPQLPSWEVADKVSWQLFNHQEQGQDGNWYRPYAQESVIWWYVRGIQCQAESDKIRRDNLQLLIWRIGIDAFWRGALPDMAPWAASTKAEEPLPEIPPAGFRHLPCRQVAKFASEQLFAVATAQWRDCNSFVGPYLVQNACSGDEHRWKLTLPTEDSWVWFHVMMVQSPEHDYANRRLSLQRLIDSIGVEAFWRGQLPSMAPWAD